jgi:hypothetical protein
MLYDGIGERREWGGGGYIEGRKRMVLLATGSIRSTDRTFKSDVIKYIFTGRKSSGAE